MRDAAILWRGASYTASMAGRIDASARITLAALAWLAGIVWQLQQAATLPAAAAAALAVAAVVALLPALMVAWRWPRAGAFTLTWLLLALALAGFAVTDWRASQRLAERLNPALEGEDLVVTGVIAALPRLSPIGTRFVFEVEAATRQGRAVQVPPRVMLGWYQGYDGEQLLAAPPQPLSAGDRWRLPVRLKQPHGAMNPHGFDVELWLFEQGIGANGYVRPGAQQLGTAVAHPVERLRQSIRDRILVRLNDPAAAGVLAALAVGDQAAIDRDDWEVFRQTGVAHLMSISGLHVTMFAWAAGLITAALWRRSSRLMLVVPAPTAARWGGLACAAAYALLAGWGVPAQRTVCMIAVVVLLRASGSRWPAPLMLLAAAAFVTAVDPWALMQPGFWLSFVAVGLLMVAADDGQVAAAPAIANATGWRALMQGALRTQLIATIGLAPLSMVFFQQVSLVGFVANLFAIPVVTFLITPLALLGVLLPPLWLVGAWAVQGLQAALSLLSQTPAAVWTAAAAPVWAMAAGLCGGALLVLPLPWRLRLLGLPLLLPLLLPPVPRPALGEAEAVVVDIGQGTAVLVRTRHHLLVYDTGPQYSADADAGQRVLLPLLRARGERRIDLLLLSHRDADHVGGAASLLAGIEVLASSSSLADSHPLRARLPAHSRCDAGQRWLWDGVVFEVLHPPAADHALALKPNAMSCVLKLTTAAGRSLLLTGDIEAAQEAALVERAGPALRSSVMLVPHHGSRTSSTAVFINAVAPEVALVQAGYRSRFGHPAPDVIGRYADRGVQVVRSDRCGAYHWPAGVCERKRALRYWHHPAGAASAAAR